MSVHLGNKYKIELDPETHVYKVNGVVKPGANQILKAVGLSKDWSGVDPFYRDRGIAVHSAINLFLRGELDEESLDPVIVPYFNQFKEWLSENEAAGLLLTERPLYSERLDFCGTIDLIMNETIFDFKCSKRIDKETERQYRKLGSAYRTLVCDDLGLVLPYKLMLLTGEGKAKVIPMDCPVDIWEAVMTLYTEEL